MFSNFLRRVYRTPKRPARMSTSRIRLSLNPLESREVLSANGIALASFNGVVDSTVNLYDAVTTAKLVSTITPFAGYKGPMVAHAADVNGDGISDIIVGAQAPNGHVKVFDGATGNPLQSFFAFPGFNGAVNVGAADVNGDGRANVLVTASATNAHVKAFSGSDGTELASFFAFPGFLGPVAVTGADITGDGRDEIVVGAGGPGVNGRVAFFNAAGGMVNPGFFAFPEFDGAISVAGGDVNGDGIPDIVVGAGTGSPGGPVKAFSGSGFATIDSIVPFVSKMTGGVDVHVADGNLDGRKDIFISLEGGAPYVAAFDGRSGISLPQLTGGDGSYSGDGSADYNYNQGDGSNGDVFFPDNF